MVKVLIVDDEKTFTDMVKLNLEEQGDYEVRMENNGKNAFSVAKEFKPDVIILDIVMPDIQGGEIANQMENDPFLKDIPIIFLTALVTKEETEKSGGYIGGRTYLAKPVNVNELINKIEEVVKNKG